MAQIKIEADNSQALRAIQQVERALGSISTSANAASRAMSGLTATMQALGAAVVGASLFNLVDQLQNMENKLRIATKSNEDFNQSLAFVKAIADKTGSSIAATGDLYAAVARNAEKLGYDTNQVATVTNAFATALKASGASAVGSASAMYQFSQILAKGKVNGDEFTTIMENLGGPVMDLVARNMGISTAELIKFKEKGLIGAKDFTDALIRSMGELDSMSGKAIPTLSQNLQRVQNAFADFIMKVDKATGLTTMLGNAMVWLSKNVDTILPILAAFVGAWAATKLIPIIASLYEMVKVVRALGVSAAVMQALATGGISALTAAAGAAVAYIAASKAFDKVDESVQSMNVNLNQTAVAAENGLGTMNSQLTGVGDKFKDILRDLKAQAAISADSSKAYDLQNQLLGYNRQLEYQMTDEQRNQIKALLMQIDIRKNFAKITEDIRQLERENAILGIADIGQRKIALELESKRRQYGEEAFNARKKEIEASIRANMLAEARAGIEEQMRANAHEMDVLYERNVIKQEQMRAIEAIRRQHGQEIANQFRQQVEESTKQLVLIKEVSKLERDYSDAKNNQIKYQLNINDLTSVQLEDMLKIDQIQRTLGYALDDQTENIIIQTENYKRQLEFLRQIKSNVEKTNTPLGGAAAGAAASGQLGALDPVKAAETANQTLFNGLQYLREMDLISEQQYQTARISAAVQANEQIMAAQQKMYETKKLYELQNQKSTVFGYETQKQIAKDSAAFEMKSTQEKYAFALDAAASTMNSLGTYNKKAFEAAKAFNVANAIMNAYLGASKAMATYPWPFSLVAAAAAVAAGMAQVAAIRSQQYSGRALGGPVMGGQSYIVGENGPELFTPSTTGSITRNGDLQGGAPVNVNFTIMANDTQGFDELLTSRQGVIKQIISDAMLERGQRSKM